MKNNGTRYMNPESSEFLAKQIIYPRIEVETYFSDPEYKTRMTKLAESGIGGFCVFKGETHNTPKMIAELQKIAPKPLLFCADFEFGLPMRFKSGTAFPHALASGMNPKSRIGDIGRAIAREARSIGIMWNLAPVCDINSNKYNPVINIRSFGNNTDIVSLRSAEYIRGTQSTKVLACAKHFPGHGDTDTDSHLSLPVLKHSEARLRDFEFLPFVNAINSGVASVMVAHLNVPAFDDKYPSTLSHKTVTGILRRELDYEGIIVTDALDMKAITDNYGNDESVILAAKAGNDVLLLPSDPESAVSALATEIDKSDELRSSIMKSIERLDKAKRFAGLFDDKFDYAFDSSKAESDERLALTEAFEAVRVIGDEKLIPLREDKQLAGFAFVQSDDIEPAAMFFKYLAQAVENECDYAFIDETISDDELLELKSSIFHAEVLLFAFFLKKNSPLEGGELTTKINRITSRFADNRPVIAVVFGNPNAAETIRANAFVLTFSDSLPSIAATIVKLAGREIGQ